MDFVVRAGKVLAAIDVKSGQVPNRLPGLGTFAGRFTPRRTLLIGEDGIPLDEFLRQPVTDWLQP